MARRRLPFMQFFVADWLNDERLRGVSLAARGAWIDLLAVMWDEPDRGRLVDPMGRAFDWQGCRKLARRVGAEARDLAAAVRELVEDGVADVDGDGVLVSRRMLRDQREREQTAERVRRCRAGVTETVTRGVTHGVTRGVTEGVRKRGEKRGASDCQRVRETEVLTDSAARGAVETLEGPAEGGERPGGAGGLAGDISPMGRGEGEQGQAQGAAPYTEPGRVDYAVVAPVPFPGCFEDLAAQREPVVAAMAVAGTFGPGEKRSWGYWTKLWGEVEAVHGEERARRLWWGALDMARGEIRDGEMESAARCVNLRLRETFPEEAKAAKGRRARGTGKAKAKGPATAGKHGKAVAA